MKGLYRKVLERGGNNNDNEDPIVGGSGASFAGGATNDEDYDNDGDYDDYNSDCGICEVNIDANNNDDGFNRIQDADYYDNAGE